MKSNRSHVVSIMNQKLTVRSEGDEAYVEEIADYVNRKIREVMERTKNVSSLTAALLTCLNMADELFQQKRGKNLEFSKSTKKVRELIGLINPFLEGAA